MVRTDTKREGEWRGERRGFCANRGLRSGSRARDLPDTWVKLNATWLATSAFSAGP
jgi:hypothetical protein